MCFRILPVAFFKFRARVSPGYSLALRSGVHSRRSHLGYKQLRRKPIYLLLVSFRSGDCCSEDNSGLFGIASRERTVQTLVAKAVVEVMNAVHQVIKVH